jgi:tetratricopeptide (TPR) repeat protein
MRKQARIIGALAAILACVGAVRADEPKAEPTPPTVAERQQQRREAFELAISAQDFDKALGVLEEMIGDKDVSDDEKLMARYFQFRIYAQEKHDGAKACPIAKKIAEEKKDEAELLNELAWTILDTEDLKNRDLDIAMEIAKLAAEASKYENSAILDTLARAYYEKGDLDKAIELQTKAVEKAQSDVELAEDAKNQVKETLERYKAEKEKKK